MIYQIEMVNHVRLACYHVRPTRYGNCIIGLSPFDKVIFITKFVIFFVIRLMDDITPTLIACQLFLHEKSWLGCYCVKSLANYDQNSCYYTLLICLDLLCIDENRNLIKIQIIQITLPCEPFFPL